MQETVTVSKIFRNEGQRHSRIVDQNRRYISVPTSQIGQFQEGQTYTIETVSAGDQGQYVNFKGFVGAPPPQQYQPSAPQVPATPPRPAYDQKGEDIAVVGIIQQCFHGTGELPDTFRLAALMRSVRTAWRDSYHDSGAGQQNDAPPPYTADPFDMSQ